MSRGTTPVRVRSGVSETAATGVDNGTQGPRVGVINANSLAYGSPGRAFNSLALNAQNADRTISDVLRNALQMPDAHSARSTGRLSTDSEPTDNELSDILEEVEVLQPDLSDTQEDNQEDEVVGARDHGEVEAEAHGSGNKIPEATEGNSRSFGTEDPILGPSKKAQAKGGPSSTTGTASKKARSSKTKGQKTPPKGRHSSESPSDQLHQEQAEAEAHRRASASPQFADRNTLGFHLQRLLPLIISLRSLLLLLCLLYGIYRAVLVGVNMYQSWEHGKPPVRIIYDQRYETLLDRVEKMEDAFRGVPIQHVEPEPIRVNYFSRGLGAMIDPHLTSPSNKHNYQARAWHRWGFGTYLGQVPSPADVLMPWDDVGDCWCAAPSDGKSQIAVMLPHRIVPTHLVVEHIPKGATLGIGAAPKDLELWVQILDDKQRDSIQAGANDVLRWSRKGSKDQTEVAPTTRLDEFEAKKSLDHTWVRLASFRYDVDAPQHIQTFKIDVELDYWGLAANKVAVRVKENWGPSDFTCLYRLKLYGKLDEPPTDDFAPEYLREKGKKYVR